MSLLLLLRNHEDGGAAPEPTPVSSGVRTRERFPLRTVTGNTRRLKLVAELGDITAHTVTRFERPDDELLL